MWARVFVTLIIIFGFMAYAYVAALNAATQLYNRGILKTPPPALINVADLTWGSIMVVSAIVVITLIISLAMAISRSRRLLGIIPVNDFRRHLLLLGPTGSGKTNAAKKAISLAIRRGVKVIVIDWKALSSPPIFLHLSRDVCRVAWWSWEGPER
ncbi:MAG: DUF87 domain-containing protein [Candidatus Caldarchaeum sp.]